MPLFFSNNSELYISLYREISTDREIKIFFLHIGISNSMYIFLFFNFELVTKSGNISGTFYF